MKSVNPSQKMVFDFIVKFIEEHKYPPARRDIDAGVFFSHSQVDKLLWQLRGLGVITWQDGKARTIVVLEPES